MIHAPVRLALIASALLSFASAARAETVTDMGASMETVLCPVAGEAITVYDDQNRPTGLKVGAHEPVRLFQGWGTNRKQATIGGSHLTLVRIQLPRQNTFQNSSLYVYEAQVVSKSTCLQRAPAPKLAFADVFGTATTMNDVKALTDGFAEEEDEGVHEDDGGEDPIPSLSGTANASLNDITKGLNTPSCCLFPIETRPRSYLSGMGAFNAGRGRRTHAGADLYGRTGQKVRAVEAGQVIRAPYRFKKMTVAVDVRHAGGFVARYGEIVDRNFGMSLGAPLARGQQIGIMAKLPCCEPMLHFELYRGNGVGKLSQGGNKYQRRSDLLDPTRYLNAWKMQ